MYDEDIRLPEAATHKRQRQPSYVDKEKIMDQQFFTKETSKPSGKSTFWTVAVIAFVVLTAVIVLLPVFWFIYAFVVMGV
jgi:hypothetical protein